MMDLKLDHIVLQTRNPRRMRDFYVKYFDASVPDSTLDKPTYLLSFKGNFKIKLLPQDPGEYENPCPGTAPGSFGLHLTFQAEDKRHVNEITCQLALDGYEVIREPGLHSPSSYTSSVLDPEGNIIELVCSNVHPQCPL